METPLGKEVTTTVAGEKSSGDFIVMSLGDSSQSKYHDDFKEESPNDGQMRVVR